MRRIGRAVKAMMTRGAAPGVFGLTVLDALVPERGYRVETDLAYGPAPRHRLDVYHPARPNGAAAPVLVFIHGGNWQFGARGLYRFVGQSFASQGVVTVVPDYRLYPAVRYPAFVEDAEAVIGWIDANIARYGGDPTRVVVMGHSAGAHTAVMLALNPAFDGHARLSGAIGLAGPYDWEPDEEARAILGIEPGKPSAMPIAYADAGAPPLLLLHGEADPIVGVANSRRLAARIQAQGGAAELVVYPGVGHERIIAALASPLRWLAPVRRDVMAFVAAR